MPYYLLNERQRQILIKKILISTLILIYLSAIVVPPKPAGAVPIALPLGIEVGVGAYVLLALGVVGAASAFGQTEFADAAYDHATYVWNTTQDTIKAEILASYKAAVDAGKKTMDISTSVMGYLTNRLGSLFVMSSPTIYGSVTGYSSSKAVKTDNGYDWYGFYPAANMIYYYDFVLKGTRYTGYNTAATADPNYGVVRFFNYYRADDKSARIYIGGANIDLSTTYFNGELVAPAIAYQQIMDYTHSFFKVMTKAEYDTIQAKKATAIATVASIPAIATPAVGDFVAHPTNDKTKTATWSPDKGWVLGDGTTVAPKDLTFEYPKPAIAADGSVSVPISGVQTGVLTGEAVGAGTANPGIDWGNAPSDKLDFGPLRLAGNLFTTKFPFSIPWDIERQFQIFNVTPKAAILKVDKTIPIFNTSMKLKFDIDFTIMEPAAVVVRWFAIIAFDLGMILSMRKFMPE